MANARLTLLCGLLCTLSACNGAEEAAPSRVAAASVSACGDKGLPDCPLQSWMKANLQAQLNTGDMKRLARALDDLAAHAPADYESWHVSATQAAEAARKNDVAAVKAECKNCHDRDRTRFRAELRKTPLF